MLPRFLEGWLTPRELKSFAGLSDLLQGRDCLVLYPIAFLWCPWFVDFRVGGGLWFLFCYSRIRRDNVWREIWLDSVVSDISCPAIWMLVFPSAEEGCGYILHFPIHSVRLWEVSTLDCDRALVLWEEKHLASRRLRAWHQAPLCKLVLCSALLLSCLLFSTLQRTGSDFL